MSSVGSSAPLDRQVKLIQACAAGQESTVRTLLSDPETQWTTQLDRDALRQGLQRVAGRGNIKLAEFLLEKGAEIDSRKENEIAAIFRAAEKGHTSTTRLLLQKGAYPDAVDKYGRTALFQAATRGYIEVLKLLIGGGANINARDKEGRTTLSHLAAEKLYTWSENICRYLLDMGAEVEAKDNAKRTALIWAADTGKLDMVKLLLDNKTKVDIEATNNRGRTALHFAAEKNHEGIVVLLLQHGANPKATSDGGWTPLHNAAEKGYPKIVDILLKAGAAVNAELSNGMTCLHWCAQNNHETALELILDRPETKLSVKDSFDRTPLLCAAERGNRDIVYRLSPGKNGSRLSDTALQACQSFEATIVDFGIDAVPRERKQRVLKNSVYDLLYGWDKGTDKPKVPSQVKNVKVKPAFRWIHIPANNLAWVDAMLTKAFVESGHQDIDGYKTLEKCFGQEHRGPTVHASFMRPFCQRISPMSIAKAYQNQPEQPTILHDGATPGGSSPLPQIQIEPATPMKGSLATLPDKEKDKDKETPKSDKKKTKAERLAERHGKKAAKPDSPHRNGTATGKGNKGDKTQGNQANLKQIGPSGKIVLFMPFLHYESDRSREKMSQAIKRTYIANDPSLINPENPTPDDLLISAYLSSAPGLHARRTLDQFFYHGIDTSDRDQDQVVWRYCKRRELERKVFMVDQLWLWILGKDLIVTSFPQRWNQPQNDPLHVLSGIIEDSNAKTRPPVKSVYDLALLITGRCSGMFDRHRLDDENYQFMDMFESSIGHVTNRETKLFSRFNRASTVAAKWLKEHRTGRSRRVLMGASIGVDEEDRNDKDADPVFVDTLLDIGTETKLLAEIKDIRDELGIIKMVLYAQLNVLPTLADNIVEEVGGRGSTEGPELLKRSKEQVKIIEIHIKDLERMDSQAQLIYQNLTHLLDLKQKHANAFEARFARDQAALTARQGQAIMMFTCVTIVFLPMSFISSVFAVNIQELPKDNGQQSLPISFVAKYMFGIGFGISLPLIILALAVDDFVLLVKRGMLRVLGRVGMRRQHNSNPDPSPSTRRYSDSRYSETEKARRRSVMEDQPRNSFTRDLSPRSDHTTRSSMHGNHVSWARTSLDRFRQRLEDDAY